MFFAISRSCNFNRLGALSTKYGNFRHTWFIIMGNIKYIMRHIMCNISVVTNPNKALSHYKIEYLKSILVYAIVCIHDYSFG